MEIGDRIMVLNNGNCYPLMDHFFAKNDLDDMLEFFKKHDEPRERHIYMVIGKGKHPREGHEVAVIQDEVTQQVYLINSSPRRSTHYKVIRTEKITPGIFYDSLLLKEE